MRGPSTVDARSKRCSRPTRQIDVDRRVRVEGVEHVEEQPDARLGANADLLLDAEVEHAHVVLTAGADRLGEHELRPVVQQLVTVAEHPGTLM